MNFSMIADAAQFQGLRQDGTRLKQEMLRLTGELSSGQQADLGRATGGDFSMLAHLNRAIRLQTTFAQSIAEAAIDADFRQVALTRVETEIDSYGPTLLSYATGGSLQNIAIALDTAPARLGQAVAALNTRVADRFLFSGDRPDQVALKSDAAMLDQIRPLVAGAATGADVIAIVDDWFLSAGGGFEVFATADWQGGTGVPAPAVLGEMQQEQTGITARDPAVRTVLAGLALAALAAEGAGPSDESDYRAVVSAAAERMLQGGDALIRLRAALGASQERIEEARVSSEAARSSAEIEKGRLAEADPYRTATDLQAVQTRLEQLYILTARLSRLTLSEYLR